MIRKPWQIWLTFFLGLIVVIPAMTWLTVKTIQLDALRENDRIETELARQEAELQERISSALYRMDLKMLPLIAQEASRPFYFYKPFYRVANPGLGNAVIQYKQGMGGGGGRGGGNFVDEENQESLDNGGLGLGMGGSSSQTEYSTLPSPLLFRTPEFVLLHFQMSGQPDANANATQSTQTISSPQRPVGIDSDMARIKFGIARETIDENEKRMRSACSLFSYDSLLADCPQANLPQFTASLLDSAENQLDNQNIYSVPAASKLQKQIVENFNDQNRFDQGLPKTASKAQVQRSRGASRVNAEFNRRLDSTQEFADQQWQAQNTFDNQFMSQGQTGKSPNDDVGVREGVMQPFWVDDNLVLARRVDGPRQASRPLIQVCWLDWDAIQTALKAEVADLIPDLNFEPIRKDSDLKSGTALTTIPVQLVVESSNLLSSLAIDSKFETQQSGLKLSLWVAWLGLGLAALASGVLLFGVIQLSERRATFVSAVTHELRTPLTTFRMYAEMLAEKMVPEGKQQEYAQTLKIQADRLSHLVENVLQFARLERGSDKIVLEQTTVKAMLDRFAARLVERANEANMNLSLDVDPSLENLPLQTQPSTVEQIVFNLVDNACKYGHSSSDRRIIVGCERAGNMLRFTVRDHGPGVEPEYRKRMFQPFCKSDQDAANTAAGVGLGLALCRRMADSIGGRLEYVANQDGKSGATFRFELPFAS